MSEDYRTEGQPRRDAGTGGRLLGRTDPAPPSNFPISGIPMSRRFIRALGVVKKAAAQANRDLGLIDDDTADAIVAAADEVIAGDHDDQFPVDVFQTGSGTSSNMNANEVIANRAAEIAGAEIGDRVVHPNDHVNYGQSSNDVIPDRDARRGARSRREGPGPCP